MTDASIHLHASTLEYYVILAGSGKMVLGQGESERVVPFREGSVILLPPGQAHGIVSDDPAKPIQALLTFTPGLAPVSQPDYRDEQILHARIFGAAYWRKGKKHYEGKTEFGSI